MSETRDERTISKNKNTFSLLLANSSMREEVTRLYPLVQSPFNEFWNEAVHGAMTLNDCHIFLKYESPLSFDMNCDNYLGIFNKVMSGRSYAVNYFQKRLTKSFKNSYMFKRRGVLSIFGILKTKRFIKYSRLVSMDLNPRDSSAHVGTP